MYRDQLARLIARACELGAVRRTLLTWEWENHGDCLKPVRMVTHARKDRPKDDPLNRWSPGDETPLTLYHSQRCRACEACLGLGEAALMSFANH